MIAALTILALVPASQVHADQQANAIGATVAVATALAMACGTAVVDASYSSKSDEDEHPFATAGPMISLGANAAVGPLGDADAANASYGFNVSAGYRCHERFATEVEFEWLGGFQAVGGSNLDPLTVTSNLRVYGLTGRIQPYVLFGSGIMWVAPEGGETGMTIRAGAGVDFYLTHSLLLNGKLDYVVAFQQLSGTDYLTLSAGVGYRF